MCSDFNLNFEEVITWILSRLVVILPWNPIFLCLLALSPISHADMLSIHKGGNRVTGAAYIFRTRIGIRETFVRYFEIWDVDGMWDWCLFSYENRESKKNCNGNQEVINLKCLCHSNFLKTFLHLVHAISRNKKTSKNTHKFLHILNTHKFWTLINFSRAF